MKNTMGACFGKFHAYIELWVNYHDNCDIKQHYRDMRISVIAQPYRQLLLLGTSRFCQHNFEHNASIVENILEKLQ